MNYCAVTQTLFHVLSFCTNLEVKYHEQMNYENFKMGENKLLPNVPPELSVIVMYNAACHSALAEKIPTK